MLNKIDLLIDNTRESSDIFVQFKIDTIINDYELRHMTNLATIHAMLGEYEIKEEVDGKKMQFIDTGVIFTDGKVKLSEIDELYSDSKVREFDIYDFNCTLICHSRFTKDKILVKRDNTLFV